MDKLYLSRKEKVQYNKRQQETLKEFYKGLFASIEESGGQLVVAGIFEIIFGIIMCIPYQEILVNKGLFMMVVFFGMIGVLYYNFPYRMYWEERKQVSVYEILRFLPVSKQQIRLFRLKKIALFCFRAFLVMFVGQLFFAFIAFHEICWGNIWYPVVVGFLIPFGIGSIPVWQIK